MRIQLTALSLVAFFAACSSERKFSGEASTSTAAADAVPAVTVDEIEVPLPEPEPMPVPEPEPVVVVPEPEPVVVVPEPEPVIPGEPVEQFGVNFEDSPGTDADYNDAVLCFKGSFVKDAKKLTSTAEQKVEFTTASEAGCDLKIEVTITRKDGTAEKPMLYGAKAKDVFLLDFKKGDSINVVMLPVSPLCGGPDARREMTDDTFGKIEAVCNK